MHVQAAEAGYGKNEDNAKAESDSTHARLDSMARGSPRATLLMPLLTFRFSRCSMLENLHMQPSMQNKGLVLPRQASLIGINHAIDHIAAATA